MSASSLGKSVRLKRIFSHPSNRILSVAIDHLMNYPIGMPEGLRNLPQTIDKIAEGRPSAITMNKGSALHCMVKHAGKVPFIVQQIAVRADESCFIDHAGVEEVVAMGADAIAVSIVIKGKDEARQIRHLAQVVREAEQYGLPVIPHIYPLGFEEKSGPTVSNSAEDVFYSVRIGIEMGVDLIKVPFTGDAKSFGDIVRMCPVPIVTAGGPKCNTLDEAIAMIKEVVKSGAAGSTVGRNVWGFPNIPDAIGRLKQAMFAD